MASKGLVKFFNNDKGFGFIQTDDQGDIFVHANDLTDGNVPLEGDEVYYDAIFDDYKQKTKASNVSGGSGGPREAGGGKGYGKGKGGGKGYGKDSYGGGGGYGGNSYGGGYNSY